MKVVLFCGGLGMRLRDYSESIPKPMVPVGYRPILWHVMRYYAHYGHKDFILCLGYKADAIKRYFLDYDETISNDFVISDGGKKVDLLASDIQDWKITFVDTGSELEHRHAPEGRAAVPRGRGDVPGQLQRRGLGPAAAGDDRFLPGRTTRWPASSGSAPTQSFHLVSAEPGGQVNSIRHVKDIGMRVNGGFFVLAPETSSTGCSPGEELVAGALPAAGGGRKAALLQLRRLLGLHGHLQGQAAAGGPLQPGAGPLGGLEAGGKPASR